MFIDLQPVSNVLLFLIALGLIVVASVLIFVKLYTLALRRTFDENDERPDYWDET
jgi:sensor domain CHASE-containing protein